MILFAIATLFGIVLLACLVAVLAEASSGHRSRIDWVHARIGSLLIELEVRDKQLLRLERRIAELDSTMYTEAESADERTLIVSHGKRLDLVEAKAEKTRAAYQSFTDRMKNLKPF